MTIDKITLQLFSVKSKPIFLFLLSCSFALGATPFFKSGTPISTKPQSKWIQAKTLELPSGVGNVYSLKYHADGKSAIIGTTDFQILRISITNGKLIWKITEKMMFKKEFDGFEIFDVSPNGQSFLSFGMTDPKEQTSERTLVIRSSADGHILREIPTEHSLFYSETANIDYRYPGKEAEREREEAGLGRNWILTIDKAVFIDSGKKILASYKHNMDGPHFYDRRLIIYDSTSGKKLSDFQLVSDSATANWDQPGGFEIGHYQFPFTYSKNNTILFGTAHGRIHEVDKQVMHENINASLVENKPFGKILYIPQSDSEDFEIKDRQSVRGLALSPDGKKIYLSAGTESGSIQVYGYNLESKKEFFRSEFLDTGDIKCPSNQILVLGGIFSTAKLTILDIEAGEILFSGDGDVYVHSTIFDTHPNKREILGLGSGNKLIFLQPETGAEAW